MTKKIYKAYCTELPFIDVPPIAKIYPRAPTVDDKNFSIGYPWVYKPTADTTDYYIFGGLDSSDNAIWVDAAAPAGSTTTAGIVRLATVPETLAGIATDIANTPAGLAAVAIAGAPNWSETVSGIGKLSNSVIAIIGSDDTTAMTPLKVAEVFATPHSIGSATPAAGAFTTLSASGLASLNASATIVTGAVALNLGADASTGAINLGTGAGARTITFGNITGATTVNVNTGTGGFNVATTGTGDVVFNPGDKFVVDAAGTIDLNSSAAVINIGNDDVDQNINIGTDGVRTLTLGSANGAAGVVIIGGTGGITIGNNAIAHNITIGNDIGATALALVAGTGNFTLNGVAGTTYRIGASTTTGTISIGGTAQTGAITLGSSSGINIVNLGTGSGATTVNIATGVTAAKAVNIGTGAIANVIKIGSVSGASSLDLLAGTGNFSINGAATTNMVVGASLTTGVITIGGTAQTGTITLGDSSGINIVEIGAGEGATTVNIAGGATAAKVVNIATGAVANLVTIGSASGAAALTLLAGTGNFSLDGAATTNYTFAPTTTSGTINIGGTGANTGTMTIAGGTGAQTIDIAASTGIKTINFGTGAAANIVTIGTENTTAALNLKAGSGGVNVYGDLALTNVATKITMNGGAETDFIGQATLVLGTVTIANTNIAATDRIFLQRRGANASTALGELNVSAITAGASFVITSQDLVTPGNTETGDLSTVDYFIVRQS